MTSLKATPNGMPIAKIRVQLRGGAKPSAPQVVCESRAQMRTKTALRGTIRRLPARITSSASKPTGPKPRSCSAIPLEGDRRATAWLWPGRLTRAARYPGWQPPYRAPERCLRPHLGAAFAHHLGSARFRAPTQLDPYLRDRHTVWRRLQTCHEGDGDAAVRGPCGQSVVPLLSGQYGRLAGDAVRSHSGRWLRGRNRVSRLLLRTSGQAARCRPSGAGGHGPAHVRTVRACPLS